MRGVSAKQLQTPLQERVMVVRLKMLRTCHAFQTPEPQEWAILFPIAWVLCPYDFSCCAFVLVTRLWRYVESGDVRLQACSCKVTFRATQMQKWERISAWQSLTEKNMIGKCRQPRVLSVKLFALDLTGLTDPSLRFPPQMSTLFFCTSANGPNGPSAGPLSICASRATWRPWLIACTAILDCEKKRAASSCFALSSFHKLVARSYVSSWIEHRQTFEQAQSHDLLHQAPPYVSPFAGNVDVNLRRDYAHLFEDTGDDEDQGPVEPTGDPLHEWYADVEV